MGITSTGSNIKTPWDILVSDTLFNIESNGGKVSGFEVIKDIDQGDKQSIIVKIRFYDVDQWVSNNGS